jgi:hypothetical protein
MVKGGSGMMKAAEFQIDASHAALACLKPRRPDQLPNS